MVAPSPVFLAFVAVMVVGAIMAWRGEPAPRFGVFVFVIAGWIVSLCLHEFGHAFFAWRSGDRTAAERGYLTLNPLRYSNAGLSFGLPILFLLLGGIGLPGGAVYVNRAAIPGRVRHSLISAAGPLANAVFAVALAAAVGHFGSDRHLAFWAGAGFLCFLQVTAALLNLLPVPGLDGYGIVEPYLPAHWSRQAAAIAPYGLLAVIAVLWFGPINRAFFSGVTHLTTALGVNSMLVAVGDELFRFWSH